MAIASCVINDKQIPCFRVSKNDASVIKVTNDYSKYKCVYSGNYFLNENTSKGKNGSWDTNHGGGRLRLDFNVRR